MTTQERTQAATGVTTTRPIIVGVDGSAHNDSAVAWAAAEAERSGRELVLVSASNEFVRPLPMYSADFDSGRYEGQTARVVERLTERITSEHPGVSLQTCVKPAEAEGLILEIADDADLVVVGKRGLGTFARLMVGSTSIAVAGRSTCPTVVVPDSWDEALAAHQPVVVGVDVHQPADASLEFAFARADRLAVPLVVVYGWETHPAYVLTDEERREWGQQAADQVGTMVEPWRALFPDVQVDVEQRHEHPAFAVLDKGLHAQLIVLGRHTPGRRLGGFTFGSVARAVLHYSTSPVAVVPEPSAEPR